MSAIGDYIHLHASNYLKYGTSKKGESKRTTISQVYSAQKIKNQERINKLPDIDKSILAELETRVRKNLPEGRDGAEDRANLALAERKLADAFKSKLLAGINGNVEKAGLSATNIQNIPFNNLMVNVDRARNLRDRINDNIRYINQTYSEAKGINPNTVQTLAKNFTEYFRALGACLPEGAYVIPSSRIQSMDMVTAMQAVVREMSFVDAHKATINGAWGEQTVALCGDLAVEKAYESVNGIIVGSQVSSFQLNESQIPRAVGKQFQIDTGINLYRAHASQDKVDVQIVVNKRPLNVSVKAYTPKGNVINAHLQDIALLTSLASTVDDFANHWLNLHCATANVPSSGKLDSALEEHMKYEALVSGNLLKQGINNADTFVAIDTIGGRVYSASTKDILKNPLNFYMRPSINSLRIGGNRKATSWEQRISNILQHVHATKISVILKARLQ